MSVPFKSPVRWRQLFAGLVLASAFAANAHATISTKTVSLDAEDAYIPSVLKILAEKGGLNIITGPGVSNARISIHMKDVPIDQAVNLVVRAAGLAYERIGNSVLVGDAQSLKEETGLSSYIIDLKFADANEVKAAIADLADKVQVDKSGNRLIIVTSPRIISEVQEVVDSMDRPVQQVMLEARIVEVSVDDLKNLGVDWDQLNHQGTVIVEGPKPAPTPDGVPPSELPYIQKQSGQKFPVGPWSRQAMAFNVALDLVIHNGNGRVIANPRVATLNGKPANILVGQRIPYETSQTVFAGGAASPTVSVQREEVGIKLEITPLINADGYITTTISPEVSSIVGFVGRNGDLPQVSTRNATTTVRLKDGNSVIIGGLLAEETTTNITKVPLLGDVPVLGYLFQHKSETVRKTDLVIEVTPHIMAEQK
jgi:type IV pilus secretin PilQ/predicted competence protein